MRYCISLAPAIELQIHHVYGNICFMQVILIDRLISKINYLIAAFETQFLLVTCLSEILLHIYHIVLVLRNDRQDKTN